MKLWSLKNKRILIIDDIPGMRSMLKNMLHVYTPETITEASDGEEAIKLIAEDHFDIILCDYNLGSGKDGQQILEEAKERDLLAYATIYIMITAENTSEMVMGAVEYIPDDYLSKPFTKEVLITRLKKLDEKKENLTAISLSIEQHDYASAISQCGVLLKQKPKNRYELLKIQSDLYIRTQDFDNAENIVRAILDEREIPWALLNLGKIYFYRNNFDEAQQTFESLIENNPNYLFAHDWLSTIHEKKGEFEKSQETLSKAVEKSPKGIKRQQALAKISFKNSDFDTSEKAYKRIVRTGKNSCYMGPDDFSGLAQVYIKKEMATEALDTLRSMRKSFNKSDPESSMKSHVNEALIYHEMLNTEKTLSVLNVIMELFNASPGSMHSEDAISIALLCYSNDMTDDGNTLIRHAIRNNHDNQDIINEIIKQLSAAGLSKEMIDSLVKIRDEVVELNNRGVKLATSGKIKESISLFIEAASAMSENRVINLNTAQSLIMHMKNTGASHVLLKETKNYLDRVSFDGIPSDKYRMLTAIYRELKKSIGDE